MNSTNYNEVVLSKVKQFFREHAKEGYIFMQDNAPSHRSQETKVNLALQQIPCIKFPLYSPDLNLIKHV
jgi:transposase